MVLPKNVSLHFIKTYIPLNYLTVENLSKTYGEKVLFQDLSLQISQGEKIAIVARNGSGKSTLLRVLAGEEQGEGERASISFKKGINVGFLKQEPDIDKSLSILDAIYYSDNPILQLIKDYNEVILDPSRLDELEKLSMGMDDHNAWDMDAKIKSVLSHLNITDLDKVLDTMSGGQLKRLALAKQIIDEPDFLILDEPTNHLDIDMIEWLEEYLQQRHITLLMVTHDRYFLERVCDTILELEQGVIYRHKGNYAQFLERKAIRETNDGVVLNKANKLLKKELEWVRRMPQARTTKSKSRTDAFHKLKDSLYGKKHQEDLQIEIKGQRMGSKIVELQYISKSYGDLKILEDFHYKFKKNEKVGIVGPNGVGKSTLLKMILGEVKPDAGKVVIGSTIAFGNYSQDGLQLEVDMRVIDVVREVAEYIPLDGGGKLTATGLLERFLFSKKQQQVYASKLSGGEKRRLFLLTILMTNPNFLILDEPTNDLDIVTLNILEDFLMIFPGCVLIVTHDRYFMDKVVDHIFVFEGDGKVKDFNGNYSEYKERYDSSPLKIETSKENKKKEVEEAPASDEPEKRKLTYEERKVFSRLEKEIAKLEERKKEIHELFLDLTKTPEELTVLTKELGTLQDTLDDREEKWMEMADFV